MPTEEQTIQAGMQAQEMLSNEATQMALNEMIQKQLDTIKDSDPSDQPTREAAYHRIKSIDELKSMFRVLHNRGEKVKSQKLSRVKR